MEKNLGGSNPIDEAIRDATRTISELCVGWAQEAVFVEGSLRRETSLKEFQDLQQFYIGLALGKLADDLLELEVDETTRRFAELIRGATGIDRSIPEGLTRSFMIYLGILDGMELDPKSGEDETPDFCKELDGNPGKDGEGPALPR